MKVKKTYSQKIDEEYKRAFLEGPQYWKIKYSTWKKYQEIGSPLSYPSQCLNFSKTRYKRIIKLLSYSSRARLGKDWEGRACGDETDDEEK